MGALSLLWIFALPLLAGSCNVSHNQCLFGNGFLVLDSGLAYDKTDVSYEYLEDLVKLHGLDEMGLKLMDFTCMKHTKVVEDILSGLPFKQQCSYEDGVNRIHRVHHFCYERSLIGKNISESTYIKLNRFLLVSEKNLSCIQHVMDFTFGLSDKVKEIRENIKIQWNKVNATDIMENFKFSCFYYYYYVKDFVLALDFYIILAIIGFCLKSCEILLGMRFVTHVGLLYLGYTSMRDLYDFYEIEDDKKILILMVVLETLTFIMYFVLIDQMRILSIKIKEVVRFLNKDLSYGMKTFVFVVLFIMGIFSNALLAFFVNRLAMVKLVNIVNFLADWKILVVTTSKIILVIMSCLAVCFAVAFIVNITAEYFNGGKLVKVRDLMKLFSTMFLAFLSFFILSGMLVYYLPEAFVWLLYVIFNFLVVWTFFCGINFIFNGFFKLILNCVLMPENASRKFNFGIQLLINLQFLYYTNVIKRVIIFNFFIPMVIYCALNFLWLFFTCTIMIVLSGILFFYCLLYAREGMDTVMKTTRGVEKKKFVVNVMIEGVDPGLLSKINNSMAENWGKFMLDHKIHSDNITADFEKHLDRIRIDLARLMDENSRFNTNVQNEETKYNREFRANWQKNVVNIVANQMRDRVSEILNRRRGLIEQMAARENLREEDRRRIEQLLRAPFDDQIFNDQAARARLLEFLRMLQLNNVQFTRVENPAREQPENIQIDEFRPEFLEELPPQYRRVRCVHDQIEAEYEEEACVLFQEKWGHLIPIACSFSGIYVVDGKNRVKGSWYVRRIDEVKESITYKCVRTFGNSAFYFLEILNRYLIEVIVNGLEYWRYMLFDEKVIISQHLVNLLEESKIFDDFKTQDYHDLVYNQSIEYPVNEAVFVDFVREIASGDQTEKFYQANLKEVYKRIMSERKKNKQPIENFKYNMVPLIVLMQEMKTTILPKRIPYGFVLVSYSGIPYMIPNGIFNKYRSQLALMEFFEKKKMCMGFGGVQSSFIEGHISQPQCEKNCCLVMECFVDYGYSAKSIVEYAIANKVENSNLRSKVQYSCNVLPTSIPIRGVYAILNNGIVSGCANMINVNGLPKLITAAHNVYKRGDGAILRPGEWSETVVKTVDGKIMERERRRWNTEVFEEKGFIFPDVIEVEDITGRRYQVLPEKRMGELALLRADQIEDPQFFNWSSDFYNMNPHYLYCIEQLNANHVPRFVPIFTIDQNGYKVYDYRSGAGYSGGALCNEENLIGIHLSGTNAGQAVAFARITMYEGELSYTIERPELCEFCKGCHSGSCCDEFCQDNGEENDYDDRIRAMGKRRGKKLLLSKYGDQYHLKILDPEDSHNINFKVYKSEDLLKKNLVELIKENKGAELVFARDLNTVEDTVFCSPEMTSLEEIYKMVDDLETAPRQSFVSLLTNKDLGERGHSFETLHSNDSLHPISNALYKDLVAKMGENPIIELLGKSVSELSTAGKNLQDSIITMKEQQAKLKVIKNEIENSVTYRQAIDNYKKAMVEWMAYKKEVADLNKDALEARKAAKLEGERIRGIINDGLKSVEEKKKKFLMDNERILKTYAASTKDLVLNIAGLQKKISELKKGSNSDNVISLKKRLDDLSRKIKALNEEKKKIQDIVNEELQDNASLIKECKTRVQSLSDELAQIKDKRKKFIEKSKEEMNEFKVEKNGFLKMREEIPDVPPTVTLEKKKPIVPENSTLTTVQEELNKLKNALKNNFLLKSVIDALLNSEKQYTKKMNLSKIMEKENNEEIQTVIFEEINQYYEAIDEVKELMKTNHFSIEQRQIVSNLILALIYSCYKNMVQIFKDDDAGKTYNVFSILDFVYNDLFEKADGLISMDKSFYDLYNSTLLETNQVFEPVYVHLTPQMANSQIFKQMCICPQQPALINCSRCSISFSCDRDHLGKVTGSLKDKCCTMECLQEQVGKWLQHKSECMTNPNKTAMSMRPHSCGVCMHCCHVDEGKNYQVMTCANHEGSANSCLTDRQSNSGVKIVTMNEDRWIDIGCLMSMIYRMAIPHKFGECSKKIQDKDQDLIMKCLQEISGIGVTKIGEQKVNLNVFPASVRAKMMSLLQDYKALSFETIEFSQSLDIRLQQLEERLQSVEKVRSDDVLVSRKDLETVLRKAAEQYSVDKIEETNTAVIMATQAVINKLAKEIDIPLECLEQEEVIQNLESFEDLVNDTEENVIFLKSLTLEPEEIILMYDCVSMDGVLDPELLEKNQTSLGAVLKDKVLTQVNTLKKNRKVRRRNDRKGWNFMTTKKRAEFYARQKKNSSQNFLKEN